MSSLLVEHEPASAALVRRSIAAELADSTVPPAAVEEVVLVASELVGNAIRHTPPSPDHRLRVEWELEADVVTIRVGDAGRGAPRLRHATLTETNGRGLTIVEAIAAGWGYQRVEAGKYVWARVPVGKTGSAAGARYAAAQ